MRRGRFSLGFGGLGVSCGGRSIRSQWVLVLVRYGADRWERVVERVERERQGNDPLPVPLPTPLRGAAPGSWGVCVVVG